MQVKIFPLVPPTDLTFLSKGQEYPPRFVELTGADLLTVYIIGPGQVDLWIYHKHGLWLKHPQSDGITSALADYARFVITKTERFACLVGNALAGTPNTKAYILSSFERTA